MHSPDTPVSSRFGGRFFVHRCESALNTYPHVHLVLIEGTIASFDEGLRLHPAQLTADAVKALREAIRARVLRLFQTPRPA